MDKFVDLEYIRESKDPTAHYLLRVKHAWDITEGYYAVDLGAPYSSRGEFVTVVLDPGSSSQNEAVVRAMKVNEYQMGIIQNPEIPAKVVFVSPVKEVGMRLKDMQYGFAQSFYHLERISVKGDVTNAEIHSAIKGLPYILELLKYKDKVDVPPLSPNDVMTYIRDYWEEYDVAEIFDLWCHDHLEERQAVYLDYLINECGIPPMTTPSTD